MSDVTTGTDDPTFGGLTPLITGDADLRGALSRIALAGCRYVTNCTAASVTVIEGERPATVGSSDDLAVQLDQAQYVAGDGPCLAAARDEQVVLIADMHDEHRWPRFVAAAIEHGVQSSLSIPIPIASERMCAGLNLHSAERDAFGEIEHLTARAFASQASTVVANAHAYWAALELSHNLSTALESRPVIDQAKGVLMARHRITADEAFDRLRRRSQVDNRKLRDVAQDVLDQLGTHDG